MASTTDRVGHVINQRYEAIEILGRGGQGIVYRGLDRWMQRPVAIKVLGSKAAREPQTAERMLREQQALSALKGTAAVEVFDICRGDEGELCLVMELLAGMELDSYLYALEQRGERLDLPRIVEIFDPIVETLDVAHHAGIVHRDLKPANVFLLREGGVRLLDFGMARLRTGPPLTAAGTVLGSPSFMAPEAWKGQSELVDHRADVYSLGVILYLVLAGDLPFAGDSLHLKFLGTTRGARPSLRAKRPDLPPSVDEWVGLALAVDREQRFGNVRALWNAFFSAFEIESLRPGRRPSFWAAAKDAVKRIAGGSAPAPRAPSAWPVEAPPARPDEATIARPIDAPPAPSGEATIARPVESTLELTGSDLEPAAPPPPPPRRKLEETVELSDSNLIARKDTNPPTSTR